MRNILAILMLSAMLIAACGGDKGEAATLEQVRDRIVSAGLGCGDFVVMAEPYSGATRSADCKIDGGDAEMHAFKDSGQANTWRATGNLFCSVVPGVSLPMVQGNAWVVVPDSETTARKLAKAIGGEVHVTRC